MAQMDNRLSFLVSPPWWQASVALVLPHCSRFFILALVMAFSNLCAVYSEITLSSGFNPALAADGLPDFQKIAWLCLSLLLSALLGMIAGLVSFSFWLVQLTSLSRLLLFAAEKDFAQCLKEIKAQSKYLTTVWLVGLVYLLVPILPMSVLLSFAILGSPQMSILSEGLSTLRPDTLFLMNTAAGLLMLISIDYCLILTVLSSTSTFSAKKAAASAAEILVREPLSLSILNIFLLVLNVGISAPFSLIFFLPALEPLSKNLALAAVCQVWFALTSTLTWPLSILLFAEFLKPLVRQRQSAEA